MFPLHESTQRRTCRTAFILFCVVPTVWLLTYAVWLKTPLHRHAQATELSQHTGTTITVERLLYPQPGVLRMDDVRLAHSQTGKLLASFREIEVTRDGARVTLLAAQPVLATTEIDELWRQIRRQLLDESFPGYKSLRFIANDVTLQDDHSYSQTLSSLDITFNIASDSHEVTATYKVAGLSMPQPAVVCLVYSAGQCSQFHWHTGGAALPMAPWVSQMPWLKNLGPDCLFQGEVDAKQSTDGFGGTIGGRLTHIDLNQLVSANFPHKLSGAAVVELDAEFQENRLTSLSGNFRAGPGVIAQSLLVSAAAQWNLTVDPSVGIDNPVQVLRQYNSLELDFHIDEQELSFGTESTLTMENGDRWQISESSTHNPASLIRVLAKHDDANVPATSSSRLLIRWFPLTTTAQAESGSPPKVHLRGTDIKSVD